MRIMLHSYLLSYILTLSVTYSWYSFYGVEYLWKGKYLNEEEEVPKKVRLKPGRNIPTYMWDLYKNGVNASEMDVVKGIFPKFVGASFKSQFFRNHRGKELEFIIPDATEDEILVRSEVRIMREEVKNSQTYFQIYVKSNKWIFLDERKVSDDGENWISLKAMPKNKKLGPGSVTFMILTVFDEIEENTPEHDSLHPILLLSYYTKSELDKSRFHERRKRSLESEDYEEETNRIWEDEDLKFLKVPKRLRGSCRRKPLYIKFSDIDYDSWIVAPTGYEAFQCVGKCVFPVSEHLSPTKHAILQTLLHNISPSKASRACCVPTRLDPISILYIDGNGVLTYRFRYRDMVVAECGCR